MITVAQSKTAVGVNVTASFLASGGTGPYVYSVLAGGAGGTINSVTGQYTAPSSVNADPTKDFDTIQAVDSLLAAGTARIMVGTPLLLFCDIIQNYMGLANGRVYLWDQKIPEPTDNGLFIAVSVVSCKPFASTNNFDGSSGNSNAVQSANMYANLQVDIISRGPEARDRKEEIIFALASNYSQTQQESNSFLIGKLPPGAQFVNLSSPDGAAIPYRFNIGVAMQYFVTKTTATPSFNTFQTVTETVEP